MVGLVNALPRINYTLFQLNTLFQEVKTTLNKLLTELRILPVWVKAEKRSATKFRSIETIEAWNLFVSRIIFVDTT